MRKQDRDNAVRHLDQEARASFRRILQELRSQMEVASERRATARELLESRMDQFPTQLRIALQAVMERDEMGPREGEQAPDFILKRRGSAERVRLSSFRGGRPVALIFGSYT